MNLELWRSGRKSRLKTTTQGLPPIGGLYDEAESDGRWRQVEEKENVEELFKIGRLLGECSTAETK